MSPSEFQTQMNRLVEQFGKTTYSPERSKLIFREVKDFSALWWEKTVDKFLLTCRQAPLFEELAEEIGAERERLYKIQKEQHKQDAKDFYEGTYQPEDARTICQYIVKRMLGQVSDEDYAVFVKHLTETADSIARNGVTCKTCEDCGIVIDSNNYAYRCYCPQGRKRQENYPIYQRIGESG